MKKTINTKGINTPEPQNIFIFREKMKLKFQNLQLFILSLSKIVSQLSLP